MSERFLNVINTSNLKETIDLIARCSLQQAASKSRTHFMNTCLQGFQMPLTWTSIFK